MIATPNIPEVVQKLRKSFDSEKTRPISFRIQQLRQLHKLLVEEEDLIAEALLKDLGKVVTID
jgi:acyl-CoA reductase-like NAD-dependent aldehyde dehydrogenase